MQAIAAGGPMCEVAISEVGRPVPHMSREDKIAVLERLDQQGAKQMRKSMESIATLTKRGGLPSYHSHHPMPASFGTPQGRAAVFAAYRDIRADCCLCAAAGPSSSRPSPSPRRP